MRLQAVQHGFGTLVRNAEEQTAARLRVEKRRVGGRRSQFLPRPNGWLGVAVGRRQSALHALLVQLFDAGQELDRAKVQLGRRSAGAEHFQQMAR